MDLAALAAELTAGHPDTGAYNVDDALAAAQLNAVNRTRNLASMTGSEVINAVDTTEWGTRTADQQQVVWDIVHLGTVNPFGVEATLIQSAFSGAGGVTVAALAAARAPAASRADELGLGIIKQGHVAEARA